MSFEGKDYKISDLRVLGERSFFVKGRILDEQTGQPTAARLHVRTAEGIYLPPYGHRHEVNDHFFEDYGADLKLGTTQYAYVDGEFRIELSGSQVFVEVAKGFEYKAVRRSIVVNPDTPFDIYLERSFDPGEGWMSADTHVHFLSPHTALLEAEAEDVHLVNLLASQWGDMFSNIGELGWGEALRKGSRSIWMGTENRQHMLGHISLLGTGASPIMPFAASGPMESTIGDPTWTSLAEWADRCREQGGLAILPHFPYPRVEGLADIILGKIDAVELGFFGSEFDSINFRDWYQLLNVGCRIGCVGGTDKMWAGMPLGGIRTYAYIGDADVDFPAFSTAVRAGRSLATTGPFIEFRVEGETSGAEIKLPKGGGTLDIEVRVASSVPFSVIEIVCNGETVCSVEDDRILGFQLSVRDSCWLAARVRGQGKPLPYGIPAPMAIAAHTSPVYITVHDGQLFDSSASIELNAVLEGGLLWLDTLATPAPHGNSTLREVFSMAQIELRKRGS